MTLFSIYKWKFVIYSVIRTCEGSIQTLIFKSPGLLEF